MSSCVVLQASHEQLHGSQSLSLHTSSCHTLSCLILSGLVLQASHEQLVAAFKALLASSTPRTGGAGTSSGGGGSQQQQQQQQSFLDADAEVLPEALQAWFVESKKQITAMTPTALALLSK